VTVCSISLCISAPELRQRNAPAGSAAAAAQAEHDEKHPAIDHSSGIAAPAPSMPQQPGHSAVQNYAAAMEVLMQALSVRVSV